MIPDLVGNPEQFPRETNFLKHIGGKNKNRLEKSKSRNQVGYLIPKISC